MALRYYGVDSLFGYGARDRGATREEKTPRLRWLTTLMRLRPGRAATA